MKRWLLAILCSLSLLGWAQERERTMIHIEHANQFHKTAESEAIRLLGNVHIRHDSTHFYCDSAYYYEGRNSFDAYHHVHIKINDSIDMYSRTMSYDGDRRFAEFFDEVRMTDDSTVLETEYMTYDRNEHLASYPHHGVTTRGDKRLVSEIGFYRDDLKEFRIFQDVVVTSPKYQMYTDTLYYNTRIEKMWFLGPTRILNEDRTMEGTRGYYLTERDLAYLDQQPVMYNETQRMVSDSMLYDHQRGFAKAMSHVQLTDTAYNVILRGAYGEVWEKKGLSFATDSAYAIYYDKGDSLYIAADTMFYHFKTELNKEEKILGRRHVRFFRSDMQGLCDTLTYNMADSTIRMRVEPVLWTDDAQLTGNTIDIKVAHQSIDSIIQQGEAFIISQDSIEGFNQIKGREMVSKLQNGELRHVNVNDDAKTVTWLREDDGGLIGINKSTSRRMLILMEDQSISLIKHYDGIEETLYPEKDLKENDRLLEGFIWREEERPKSKDDIWRLDGIQQEDGIR